MISKGVQSSEEKETDAVGGLESRQEQLYGKRIVVFSGELPFNSSAQQPPQNLLGQNQQLQYGLQEPQVPYQYQKQQQPMKVKIPGLKLNISDFSNNAELNSKYKQTPSNTKGILKADSARGNFKQSEQLPPPIRTSFKELAKFEPLAELGLKISSRQTPSTDTQSPSFSFQASLRPQSQQYQPLSQRQSYTIINSDNLKEPFLFQRKSEDVFRNQPDIPSAREIKDIKFIKIPEKQLSKQQNHKIIESSRISQIPTQRTNKIIPAGVVSSDQGRNTPSSPKRNQNNKQQFIPLDQMPPQVEFENKLDEQRMKKNKQFKNFNINFLGKQLTLNNKTCLMGLLKEGELKYDPSVYEKYKIYIKENNLHNLVAGDAKKKHQSSNFRTQSAQQQLESPRHQGQQEYFRVEQGDGSSRQSSRSMLPLTEEQSSRWKYNINIENKNIDEYKNVSNLKKKEFFRFQQRVKVESYLGGEDIIQRRQQYTEDGDNNNGSKFRKVTEGQENSNIKDGNQSTGTYQFQEQQISNKQLGNPTYSYQLLNQQTKNKKNHRHTAWFEGPISLIESTLRDKLSNDFIFKCYLQQADIPLSTFLSRFSLLLLHSFSTFTPQLQQQNNNYFQIRSSNNIPDSDPNSNTTKSNKSKGSLLRSSSSQLSGQFSRRRSSAVSNSVNLFSDMQLAPRFQELLRVETLKVLNTSFPQSAATFSKLLKSAFNLSFKDRGIITELGGPISTRRLLCQAFEHIQTYYYSIRKSSQVWNVDFILDLIAQDQVNLNSLTNGNKKNYSNQIVQIPISNSNNQQDSNGNDNLDNMNSSLWSAEEFLMFKLSVKCVCERQQISPRSVISFLRKLESLRQILCGPSASYQLPQLSFAAKREAANRLIETQEITRFYISAEMNTSSNAYIIIDCLLDFVNSLFLMQNNTVNINNNEGNSFNQNSNNNSNNSSNVFNKILNRNNSISNNGSSILISTPTAAAISTPISNSLPSQFGISELFTMLQSKFDLQGINNGLIEAIIQFSKENIFTFKGKNQFSFIEFQRSLEELQFLYDSSLSPVLLKATYDQRSKLRNGLFNYLHKTKEDNNFRSLANEEIVLNDQDKEQLLNNPSNRKQDNKITLHQRKIVPPIKIEHLKYSASEVSTPIGVINTAGGNIPSNKGLFTSPSSLQHSPAKISKSEHIMLSYKLLNERDNASSQLQMEHTCSSIHESLMLIKYLFDFTISQRNIYSTMDVEVIIEKSMINQGTFEKQLKQVGRYLTKQLDLSPQEAAAQIGYFRKYSLLYY